MTGIAETAPADAVSSDAAAEKAPDPRRHYASPEDLRILVEKNTAFWGEQVRQSNFQAQ